MRRCAFLNQIVASRIKLSAYRISVSSRCQSALNERILADMTPCHDSLAQVYRKLRAMQRASDTLFFTTSDAELAKNVSTDIFPVNTASVTCAVAVFRELGLIDDRRWAKFEKKQAQKEAEMKRAEKTVFSPTDALNEVLVSCETSPVTTGVRLSELLRRPQVTYADLIPIDTERPNYPREIFESVETALKYEGYIKRQLQDIAEMRRLEKKLLPKEINYAEISGLRLEAQEKLNRVRPENVGQAGRISGVSPADISVLLIWLSAHNEGK